MAFVWGFHSLIFFYPIVSMGCHSPLNEKSQKAVNIYKVALYTASERIECRSAYSDYYEAYGLFSKMCEAYDELPLNIICSLERNGRSVEAYRFTKNLDTFKIDTDEAAFCNMVVKAQKIAAKKPSSLIHVEDAKFNANRAMSDDPQRSMSADIGLIDHVNRKEPNTNIFARIRKLFDSSLRRKSLSQPRERERKTWPIQCSSLFSRH